MKAFISYSHADSAMLDKLHTHLAQLKRDGFLNSWTDREITAGSDLNNEILKNLESSDLFISLLSPDYIASQYCYEKEFNRALEKVTQSEFIIVPIIVEPCDWKNTPFKDFKALPTDGKPISDWQNMNTAFLNVIQELRKLIDGNIKEVEVNKSSSSTVLPTRNYKVKKDFDSIQKLEFKEKSFKEIKKLLIDYLSEVETLDGIKNRILKDNEYEFESILVNRNKVNTESKLKVSISDDIKTSNNFYSTKSDLKFAFDDVWNHFNSFEVNNDDFEIFWFARDNPFDNHESLKLESKDIARRIFEELLKNVGIE